MQGFFNNNWRRGRDSNSGRTRILDGFQDRCIKPLCHLSSICIAFILSKPLRDLLEKTKTQRGKYERTFAIFYFKSQDIFCRFIHKRQKNFSFISKKCIIGLKRMKKMRNVVLFCFVGLAGCVTYPAVQDVYNEETAVVTYVQPADVYTTSPASVYPVNYVTTESLPQIIYVSEPPETSVVYINKSVYYTPPLPTPRPFIPPHHIKPAPYMHHHGPNHDFKPHRPVVGNSGHRFGGNLMHPAVEPIKKGAPKPHK